ncbi:hypothetical protein ABFY27_11025 [Akkermansia massiliensis]
MDGRGMGAQGFLHRPGVRGDEDAGVPHVRHRPAAGFPLPFKVRLDRQQDAVLPGQRLDEG